MPKFLPLFFEPFSNRLLIYGQYQFGVIGRILIYFENIILDVELPSVFFGINPAVAPDSLFLCQKTLCHFFGETDGSAQLFHSQHLPEHRKPLESLFKQGQTKTASVKLVHIAGIYVTCRNGFSPTFAQIITRNLEIMSLKRFGVSLESELLESLDSYVKANGFTNRSQAIRFLVEKNIAEQKWQCNHVVAGAVIIMYDQTRKDIATKIADIQQTHQKLVLSSTQYYINRNFCLHIAMVMGMAYRLTELADMLVSIKGIKHGKLVMSRAD